MFAFCVWLLSAFTNPNHHPHPHQPTHHNNHQPSPPIITTTNLPITNLPITTHRQEEYGTCDDLQSLLVDVGLNPTQLHPFVKRKVRAALGALYRAGGGVPPLPSSLPSLAASPEAALASSLPLSAVNLPTLNFYHAVRDPPPLPGGYKD